jgi:MOSC domain-containing protein YiiM
VGYIEAIAISKRKGIRKTEIPFANLIQDWGIEGDAHAGKWHRQVSLLAGESIDNVKNKMPNLPIGAFAENIITRGIDFMSLEVGDRLTLAGHVVLEITQIGKECHNSCAIKKITGDCIMPREGVFSKVISGGRIQPGDTLETE